MVCLVCAREGCLYRLDDKAKRHGQCSVVTVVTGVLGVGQVCGSVQCVLAIVMEVVE